jgi:hypothetical protein
MKTKRIHRGAAAAPKNPFSTGSRSDGAIGLGSPPLFVPETLPQIPSRLLRWAFAATAAVALALVVLTCARVWLPDYGFTRFINIGREFVPRGSSVYQATPKYVTPAPGPDAGFDGQWYAEIALDPLLRDPQLRHALDDPAYRADRILLPALAWLGGLGRPSWILNAYALLNPIFWLGYVALLYVLFRRHGWAGWAGFTAMLLTCGIVESMYGALTDFPAFVLMSLAAVIGGTQGAGLLGLAALTREVNLLGLAGILEFGPPWREALRRNLRRGAVAVVPFALWFCYVRWRLPSPGSHSLGALYASMAGNNLDWPLHAIYRKLREVLGVIGRGEVGWGEAFGSVEVHALLTIIATLTQCLYLVTHPEWKNRLWRVGVAFVPYFFFISSNVWDSHFTVTRHALPFTLAFNLILALRPNRRWLIWFLLGNCFVPYGVCRFVDFGVTGPQPEEFVLEGAPLPTGTVTAAYREGWHGQEWKNRRTWRWSESPHATLVLTNTGREPLAAHLVFSSESLVPRDLSLGVRGVTVWSGAVASSPVLTPVATRGFLLPPGDTPVDFSTAVPGRLENDNPDARLIGFRVIGLAIVVAPAPPP